MMLWAVSSSLVFAVLLMFTTFHLASAMQHDSKSLDDNRLLFEDIFDERMETDANDDNVNNNNQLVNTYANHNHHHHQQQQQPHQHHHQHHHHRKRVIFDIAASGNVTTLLGRTAYLNCRVKSFSMGLRSKIPEVSWVRHRDINLLTVGRYTYSNDQRFRAIHNADTNDWTLKIEHVHHRDGGIYECQMSDIPHHISHYVYLNVVESVTEVLGPTELYIECGSTINLTCVIRESPEPPAYIIWTHNNMIISYESARGGITVITRKEETTTSNLLIQNARPADSGKYQCEPSNGESKNVLVHVLNGEFPAAIQAADRCIYRMSAHQYLLVFISAFISLSYYRIIYLPLTYCINT